MIQLMVAQINRAYSSYRRRRVNHPAAKSSAKKGCMAATSAAISSGVHAGQRVIPTRVRFASAGRPE
jgi:hypothetical protein